MASRKRYQGSATPVAVASRGRHALDVDLLPSLFLNQTFVRSPLVEVEDNRTWHPDSMPSPRSEKRWYVRSELAPRQKRTGRQSALRDIQALTFRSPRFVIRCIRRKMRKAVLHAFGKTGKGSGRRLKNKRYNRNAWSTVRC